MAETALAPLKPPAGSSMDKMIESLVASRMFPDIKQAAQAITRLHLGRSLGLSDFAAMTGLFTSQSGKVTMSANTMAMLIKGWIPPGQKSPKYRYVLTRHTDKECTADVFERVEGFTDGGKQIWAWEKIGVCSFTEADAVKAQLTTGGNKANYAKYPRNMLFARMISNMAKFYCADAFGGTHAYLPDELGDNVKVDYETLEVVAVNDAPLPTSQQTQRTLLAALIADTGADQATLLGYYKKADFESMTDDEVKHAVDVLEKRKAAK